MSRKEIVWLSGTAILPCSVALPLGLLFGTVHWLAAGIAVALLVPTAFGTLWASHYLVAKHPLGAVSGMVIGSLARLLVGFGGGAGIFFLTDAFGDFPVVYWLWLLAIYALVLVVETALLAKPIRSVNGTPNV